jgi:hypothetical protein
VKNVNPISRKVRNTWNHPLSRWKGKTLVEVYKEVKIAYGDEAMNHTSVFKWCGEFKNGHMSVHDDQRSRRPLKLWKK